MLQKEVMALQCRLGGFSNHELETLPGEVSSLSCECYLTSHACEALHQLLPCLLRKKWVCMNFFYFYVCFYPQAWWCPVFQKISLGYIFWLWTGYLIIQDSKFLHTDIAISSSILFQWYDACILHVCLVAPFDLETWVLHPRNASLVLHISICKHPPHCPGW